MITDGGVRVRVCWKIFSLKTCTSIKSGHAPKYCLERLSRKQIGRRIRWFAILSMVLDLPVPDDWEIGTILAYWRSAGNACTSSTAFIKTLYAVPRYSAFQALTTAIGTVRL